MFGIWQDFRYAGRSLTRAPGFVLAVALILAVGIGASVAMFRTVEATLLRDLPFEDPGRLVMGRKTTNGYLGSWVAGPDYYDYRDRSGSFSSLSATLGFPSTLTITGRDEPERVPGFQVTVDLFETLGVAPRLGRSFLPSEGEPGGPDVAILSHGYWQRALGGDAGVIGASLTIDGDPYTVVGVMPPGFRYLHDVEMWFPLRPDSEWVTARRFHNCLVVGRLGPGVTLKEAQEEVDRISKHLEQEHPDTNVGKALLLTDLREFLVSDFRPSLVVLITAVGLVLLIACGNAASLYLARGTVRLRELSVRSALGASRAQLIRQLLTESVLVAILAGAGGCLLASEFGDLILRFLPTNWLGRGEAAVSPLMLLFALLVSLLTGVLSGIVPALRCSRTNLLEGLKAGTASSDPVGSRFRSGLVVIQVALSVVLLIVSGLLIRSLGSLLSVDPGFDMRNLLTSEIQLPESDYAERERRIQFFSDLAEEIRAMPGVTAVALASQLPFRDPGNDTHLYAADNPPSGSLSQQRSAYQRTVFPGYFKAMGIPLLAGRDFSERDAAGTTPVMVITRAVADHLFRGKDPLGRQVVADLGQPVTFEVVGVVGDARLSSLRSKQRMAMYFSYRQRPHYTMRIAVRTAGDPGRLANALRAAVRERDRNLLAAGISTMQEIVGRSLLGSRTTTMVLSLFAGVAAFLAAMGLYGLLAYYVSQRFHEIGIRIALGASPAQIMEWIFRRGVGLTLGGMVLGLLAALALTRLIQQLLFGVQPTDPTTFIVVSLLFGLVAFIACLVPARRAVRVDPQTALQTE